MSKKKIRDLPRYFLINNFGKYSHQFIHQMAELGAAAVIDESQLESGFKASAAILLSNSLGNEKLLHNPDTLYIAPSDFTLDVQLENLIIEVTTLEEAARAVKRGVAGLIAKGNEASGVVGSDSTFILFQKIRQQFDVPIWLRGGIGFHSSAALIALGAYGVVLEECSYMFPEMGVPAEFQTLFSQLNGTETREIHGHRCFLNLPYWPKNLSKTDIDKDFLTESLSQPVSSTNPFIALGQAIGLAQSYLKKFTTLENFISSLNWTIESNLLRSEELCRGDINIKRFKSDLGLNLPIAQGPMTRVSDVPSFTDAVSNSGALPFFALAMLRKDEARSLLRQTKDLLGNKPWGVGVLGFIDKEIQQEQFEYVKEVQPPFVLVAGGDASHVKAFEAIGSTTFLHTPSTTLLDLYIKDGVRNFVFEGRECGGHIGPLASFVLWEQALLRLLAEDDISNVTCFFAGGIHDALSSATVHLMAAPLIARGAKVGVLMGTAYLYTEEAVTSGAILPHYQSQSLHNNDTTLLESSPGHVIRCLTTPFSNFFQQQKIELLARHNSTEVQRALDDLNVGRLRLATKGLKRTQEGLSPCTQEEQFSEGLFMIGQVAAMRHATTTLADLHKQVTEGTAQLIIQTANQAREKSHKKSQESEGIAIIGMACIFPGAQNLSEYWKNILDGHLAITEVPRERWDANIFFDAEAKKGVKSNSKWGGFIPSIEFDPTEFGIPPQSLAAIDPAQLLSLKATKEALIDAGYWKSEKLDNENTAVIFGTEGGSELLLGYELRAAIPQLFGSMPASLDDALPTLTEDSFSGTLPNVISGRIANRLDFGGRNFVVDAACASSLAAVDVACQELKTYRANMVVAGAVDLHNDLIDYLKFSSVGALSNEGLCKSFSHDSSGIALGEGVGVLILKRLSDAVADGDRIYSVIKGIGASSDGKSLGLTAPRKRGQMMAYRRAYCEANINPANVQYLEAHGTGTVVGDKVELESLTEFFGGAGSARKAIGLGSVKTQIGHTKCAAGLASVIKTSLAVYHGIKPGILHVQKPNSAYQEPHTPFELPQQSALWMNDRRTAGVSAFGFGGTNFHLVMENYQSHGSADNKRELWPRELFILRAADDIQLDKKIAELQFLIEKESDLRLADLAYTLAIENELPIQWAFTAENQHELIEKLRSISQRKPQQDVYPVKKITGKLAFLFSGQGSQRVQMAKDLFVAFPAARHLLAKAPELFDIIFPPRSFDEAETARQKEAVNRTENAQPLLGIVDLAIANLLGSIGIIPDAVAGHSYGEIPALSFAGAINQDDVVAVSKARAAAILDSVGPDSGAMLALNTKRDEIESVLAKYPNISPANHNSPTQWVLAGPTAAIHQFKQELDQLGKASKLLPVACAFHSPLIGKANDLFAQSLEHFTLNEPALPVWSNTSAALYPTAPDDIKRRLSEHLVAPVKFAEQLTAMQQTGINIFIETGPGNVLTNLVRSNLNEKAIALPCLDTKANSLNTLVDMLAKYIATGRPLDFNALFSGRGLKLLDLDALRKERRSNVLWLIKGNRADPVFMPAPAHASKELIEPIHRFDESGISRTHSLITGNIVKEQMILEYLANMRAMIEAQQNVLLGYLGEKLPTSTSHQPLERVPAINTFASHSTAARDFGFAPAATATIAPTAPAAVTQQLATAVRAEVRTENVATLVLHMIAQKTGYPTDMLDVDMDLEADLSIDSIKRTEIFSSLKQYFAETHRDISADTIMQRLGSSKTIRQIVDGINGLLPAIAQPMAASEPAQSNTLTMRAPVAETLIRIVSERTGYPQDMLNLDMDLEAELSIDSIKRTEIMSALKVFIKESQGSVDDAVFAKAGSGKTLREIANLIDKLSGASSAKKYPAAANSNEEVCRFVFTSETTPLAAQHEDVLVGKVIGLIANESACATTLIDQFTNRGARIELLAGDEENISHLDGFIYLDVASSKLTPNQLFCLTKKLNPDQLKWFMVLSDAHHRTWTNDTEKLVAQFGGTHGFINSLNKEWPAICREIRSADNETQLASYVLQEFYQNDKQQTIAHYRDGERSVNLLQESAWNITTPKLHIKSDDVILVTGGAQGITSEILQTMTEQFPCHYILAGRTPAPDLASVDKARLSDTPQQIKTWLLQTEKFSSPKALEARVSLVYKQHQILLTLNNLAASGAKVSYVQTDLTDTDSVRKLLDDIKRDHGKIDGIIHAAGHLEDKLLVDKSPESFARVLNTKLVALPELLKEFPQLKFCVFFSSVTSVFGNRGQIDYGTANGVLDLLAHSGHQANVARVIAINWGPWKDKGMIDASLEKDFLRRGVSLIGLKEGSKAFLKELLFGEGGPAILMTPVKDLSKAKDQF